MKHTLFLALFLLLMGYIFFRGYHNFAHYPIGKWIYSIAFVALLLTLFTGFLGADYLSPNVGGTLSFVGFTFLIAVLYMGVAFLLIDLCRIVNALFIHADATLVSTCRMWANAVSFGIVLIALMVGNYKFNHPDVTTLAVSAEQSSQNKHLRIVMASDLHFGNNIRKKEAQRFVKLINEQAPDIVLLAGDLADRNMEPFIRQQIDDDLRQIEAKYGVYGVAGNHEYYADNRHLNFEYYEKSGIQMLFDEAVLVDSSFYIAGRDDKTNRHRKPLSEIVADLDKQYPVILLDHQPYHLEEAEQNGVAMQFSGHTHNGQFFPGNLIVKSIYELAYGYKKKGGTHFYVSSGLGIWGPLYRIGTRSEIVVVEFSF
ncbi:MAG: metallophosphoesterase [Bacteroidales bacterium]|jgi:predicted MPP superfamily phosphohydrolase|nr:metallophosphoesterase [Bacteroidales bacterium]